MVYSSCFTPQSMLGCSFIILCASSTIFLVVAFSPLPISLVIARSVNTSPFLFLFLNFSCSSSSFSRICFIVGILPVHPKL